VDAVVAVGEIQRDRIRGHRLVGQRARRRELLGERRRAVRAAEHRTAPVDRIALARRLEDAHHAARDHGVGDIDPIIDDLVADEAQRIDRARLRDRRDASREGPGVNELVSDR
jgi:hypothetical protein